VCVGVVVCRCLSWLVGGPVVSPLQWVMLLADEAHKAIQQAATQTTTHGTLDTEYNYLSILEHAVWRSLADVCMLCVWCVCRGVE
jgi:hypothetical protein